MPVAWHISGGRRTDTGTEGGRGLFGDRCGDGLSLRSEVADAGDGFDYVVMEKYRGIFDGKR